MNEQEMILNIRYDAPQRVWDKIPVIYEQMEEWLGNAHGGNSMPYWFSFNEEEKHVTVSVEMGGFQFSGLMEDEEWAAWKRAIKEIATRELGYKVGEIAEGEVDYEGDME